MGSNQTGFVQQLASDEHIQQMILDGMSTATATMQDIIKYHEETDTWERLEDNFEITKTNIRNILHNARILQKFLNEFSDTNISAAYKSELNPIPWGFSELDPQDAYMNDRNVNILGDSMDDDYTFFDELVEHALSIRLGSTEAYHRKWEQATYELQAEWENNNEINNFRVGTPEWDEIVEKSIPSLKESFRRLVMSDEETREEIDEMSKNVADLVALVYQYHTAGVFSRAGDITTFFSEAALAKIAGESTLNVSPVLSFIDEYIEIAEKIDPNKVAKLIAKQLHDALKVASEIVDSDSTSEYLFFMYFAERRNSYSLFSWDDELLETSGHAAAVNFVNDIEKHEGSAIGVPDGDYKDKKWKWLRDQNKKKTKIVFDRGAADAHGSDPTTYLGTNEDSGGYLLTILKSVSGKLSDYNTSNLQRKSIVDFLYNLFTHKSKLWKIVSDNYNVGDNEEDLGDFFGYLGKHYEADEGAWDKATDVTRVKIYIDSDLESLFKPIFVDGENPASYEKVDKYCKHDKPLYALANHAFAYEFAGLRKIDALVEFSNRLKIVKSSIEEFQQIGDINWGPAEITNYQDLLSQKGLHMSFAFRKYYDLIQPKGKVCINNKYEPISPEEKEAMNLLFNQNKYLEHKTSEFTKIVTLELNKKDIKNQRYVEVTLTKENKLNPLATYKQKKFIIDAYLHPVFNGYVMHDTSINDLNEKSDEYIDTGEFDADSYINLHNFLVNGMKFIDYHAMLDSYSSIVPKSYEEWLGSIVNIGAPGTSKYEKHSTILRDAVENKILSKYLFSLLSFSFDTETLGPEIIDHDEGSSFKIDRLIYHHNDFDVVGYNNRAKAVLLENSSYFNNKRIINDILGPNDSVGLTFNFVVDLKEDFEIESGVENTADDIENIEIHATAKIVYSSDW